MVVAGSNQRDDFVELGQRERKSGNRSASLAAFEAASASDPNNLDVKIEIASELRALNRLDEAEIVLLPVFDANPRHIRALIEQGHIQRRRGKITDSLELFEAAARIDPRHLDIKVEIARDLRALGRLDEAGALLRNVVDADSRHLGTLIELAHVQRQRGNHAAALAAFEAAAAVDANHLGIKVQIARDLRALDRLDEAETVLRNVREADPRHLGTLIELAHVQRQRGNHAAALAAFEAAAALDPNHLGIKVQIVRDLRALDRLDEAEEAITRILDVEPVHIGALIEQAFVFRRRDNHFRAFEVLEKAAAAHPHHSGVKFEIANELRALGRNNEAETALRKLLEIDDANVAALIALSQLLMAAQHIIEAEEICKLAYQISPNNPITLSGLGHLSRRRGDRPASLRYFQLAAKAAPYNLHIRLEVATGLRERGDFNEALELIKSVLDINPHDWSALMQLGQLYRLKGDRKKSMEAFKKAVEEYPRRTQALVELAQEQWALGFPRSSQELLRQALAQEPSHPAAIVISAEQALRAEEPQQALDLATRAIEFHPNLLASYLLAARAAAEMRDTKRALSHLNQAREKVGDNPEITATYIFILRKTRDYALACSVANDAAALAKDSFPLWLESTVLTITLGDFERAEQALLRAPASSTKQIARVHFLRARLAEGRRQYPEAVAGYRDALALDPSNGGWHGEMARAYLLILDLEAAYEQLHQFAKFNAATDISRSQSHNISQYHVGHMLDEFALDRVLLGQMKDVCALPLERQVDPLKQLVRDNPDSTAAALMLVLAMRRLGLFSITNKKTISDTPNRITKRIIQFWDSNTIPPDIQELMESWRSRHADFEYLIFNDTSANAFLCSNYPSEVSTAFLRARHPAQRADIFRLAYLAREGGVYTDADDRCIASVDTFVPAESELFVYQENYGTIANNFLAAAPHHPIVVRALQLAIAAVNRGDNDIVWLSTGPGLLTRAFAQILSEPATNACLSGAIVRELWEAQRVIGIHCPVNYKDTILHWSRATFMRNAERHPRLSQKESRS